MVLTTCHSHRMAALLLLGLGLAGAAEAQKPPDRSRRADTQGRIRRQFSFTLFSTTYDNPFLRLPPYGPASREAEIQTGQSPHAIGGRLSAIGTGDTLLGTKGFAELGLSYWRAKLDDFAYQDSSRGITSLVYSDASVAIVQADLAVGVAPLRRVPAFVYGVVGLGQARMSYTTSGLEYADGNGPHRKNPFRWSYGLGVRISPVRWVSLVGEYRWLPGDVSTTSVPEGGCTTYYYSGGGSSSTCKSTSYSGHLASLGAAVNLP